MSYATWAGVYGSDPSVVGSTFLLDSKPVTVVGVAPAGFYGDRLRNSPQDFYFPISAERVLNSPPI